MGTNDVYEVFYAFGCEFDTREVNRLKVCPFQELKHRICQKNVTLGQNCSCAAPSFPERLLYGRFMSLFN